MLTPKDFDKESADLAAADDLPLELARKYVSLIGDTPELDDDGKLLVRDENDVEIARLTMPVGWL